MTPIPSTASSTGPSEYSTPLPSPLPFINSDESSLLEYEIPTTKGNWEEQSKLFVRVTPPHLDDQRLIDKTASWVCKLNLKEGNDNAVQEKLLRLKHFNKEKFGFLFPEGEFHNYYQFKLALYTEMLSSVQKGENKNMVGDHENPKCSRDKETGKGIITAAKQEYSNVQKYKRKKDRTGRSSSASNLSSRMMTNEVSLAENDCSLVSYGNDSSDNMSDENNGSETREFRNDALPSSKKSKRWLSMGITTTLFSHSDEYKFNGYFPTTSDGSIDINRIFDPNDNLWAEEVNKKLQTFIKTFDTSIFTSNMQPGEETLNGSEYELDLIKLELAPVSTTQKKIAVSSAANDVYEEIASITQQSCGSLQNQSSIARDNPRKVDFVKSKSKPKCRKYTFKPFSRLPDETSQDYHKCPVKIIIPEQLAASYGLYVWPSSPVLAWYIWLNQDKFKYKNILELGSGTALPGLLCAKIGARKVWLSDDLLQTETLANCEEAVRMNDLDNCVSVMGLTWGEYTKNLTQFRNDGLDYVIGSDLFFDPKVFEPLIKTLSYLLSIKNDTDIYISVQERSSDWTLEQYLNKWNLRCDYIYPHDFVKGTGIDVSDLIGGHTIYLMRIFKK